MSGKPYILDFDHVLSDFANEVQDWSWKLANQRSSSDVTVGEAADHFAVTPQQIIRAVRFHYWMFLAVPGTNWSPIEDGEPEPDDPMIFDDPRRLVIGHEGE